MRRRTILTDNQYKNPPVGSGGARMTPFSSPLGREWKLLVVSDGVWKYIGWERFERLAASESGLGLIEALRAETLSRLGGTFADDFSVALLEG